MKPKMSLISSVSAASLTDSSRLVQNLGLEYIDLYAFMQNDLDLLWPKSRIQPGLPRSGLYEMAAAFGNDGDLPRVADIIEQNIRPAQVAAFATYIPEITSPKSNQKDSRCAHAQRALQFLIQLAALLNSRGHPVNTIEVVGGSTVDGLWRGRATGGAPTYVVNRIDQVSSLTRLADSLGPVVDTAAKTNGPVRLALELEPGPLFNLCDKESLLKFCGMIDSMGGNFKKVVGLNLDIPHWCFLSAIDPEWVQSHPVVLNRIIHAHVCDHSRGHVCDSEPYLFHGGSDFVPWLRLLSQLGDRVGSALQYSGFLACELECCATDDYARRSMGFLKDLIDRHCI